MKKHILIIVFGLIILNCNSLIGQNDSLYDQIITKQDSLRSAKKESAERQKNIDLLNAKREFQALAIKEKEASEKKQRIVFYVGFSVFILLIAIFIGLIRRNMRLRKLLKEKKDSKE